MDREEYDKLKPKEPEGLQWSGKPIKGGLRGLSKMAPMDWPKNQSKEKTHKSEIEQPPEISVEFNVYKRVFNGGVGSIKRSAKIKEGFRIGQKIILSPNYLPIAERNFIRENSVT